MTFNSSFILTCSYESTSYPCDLDWVEVRSNINEFEVGGPRFCCSTAPRVSVSDSNEIMVLFYSKQSSYYGSSGFQASFTIFGSNYFLKISVKIDLEFLKCLTLFLAPGAITTTSKTSTTTELTTTTSLSGI